MLLIQCLNDVRIYSVADKNKFDALWRVVVVQRKFYTDFDLYIDLYVCLGRNQIMAEMLISFDRGDFMYHSRLWTAWLAPKQSKINKIRLLSLYVQITMCSRNNGQCKQLESISSTFYVRLFCTNVSHKFFSTYI